MESIVTKRLTIVPTPLDELLSLAEGYKDSSPELYLAYSEMYQNCVQHPQQFLMHTPWKFCRKEDNAVVGYAGFKGMGRGKRAEIGYGIDEQYAGCGYATEGVEGLCRWAFFAANVKFIDAETEPGNIASQKVLQKIGFLPTGVIGKEGPRYCLAAHSIPFSRGEAN